MTYLHAEKTMAAYRPAYGHFSFIRLGVTAGAKTLSDAFHLPIPAKNNPRDRAMRDPFALLPHPGGRGEPGVFGHRFPLYSRKDLETWSDETARFRTALNARVSFVCGLFSGFPEEDHCLTEIADGGIPAIEDAGEDGEPVVNTPYTAPRTKH